MGVPIERTEFQAPTTEQAWEVMGRLYTRVRPGPGDLASPLGAVSWATPGLAVDVVEMAAAAETAAEGPEQLILAWWFEGRVDLEFHGSDELRCGPGDCCLVLPRTPYTVAFDTLHALSVRLPLDVVDQVAHDLAGLEPGALRFTAAGPLTPGHTRTWQHTANLVRALLAPENTEVISNPLVHRELVTTVAAAALSVFPNTTMTRDYVPGPGETGPAAVRRAVAFVDAHASLPITVADIAEAAGTSPRSLHAGFLRDLGTTPGAYLRRVRLAGAHQDLRATDPTQGPTVAEIATRWGFTRLDRFTRAYLQSYGCPPEHTRTT